MPAAPSAPLPDPPPPLIARIGFALRRSLLRAVDALTPAPLAIAERAFGAARTEALATAVRLGLAEALAGGPCDVATLAELTGTHPPSLERLLRAMVANGIFARQRDGRYRHNRLSRALLRADPFGAHGMSLYFASRSNTEAWRGLDAAIRTGESAFRRANGSGVWEHLGANPSEAEQFDRAMAMLTAVEAPWIARLYRFSEVTTVCDLGAGAGTLAAELCVRFPHLGVTVVDSPDVLERAKHLFAARGVAERVTFRTGCLFEPPPSGADLYLLKNVLHNWDDAAATRILAACAGSLGQGAKILVIETLLDPAKPGPADERDLQMMVVCDGGRERTRDEYAALFAAAGLGLTRVWRNPVIDLLEAAPLSRGARHLGEAVGQAAVPGTSETPSSPWWKWHGSRTFTTGCYRPPLTNSL